MKGKNNLTDDIIAVALEAIDDIKGEDIKLLDLRGIENTVFEYFIICTGKSNTHASAIAGAIQKKVSKELKDKPWHVEGSKNAEWILIDYVNVVVHVFQHQYRELYDIENLWGDAKITQIA